MEKHRFSPKDFGIVHFCGIGGIGMSGIAEILHNLGCTVQGSDLAENGNTERLSKLGIKIFYRQEEQNLQDVSVIVRSSAILEDNPEIVGARKRKIPVIARADMLKEIMFLKNCITINPTNSRIKIHLIIFFIAYK